MNVMSIEALRVKEQDCDATRVIAAEPGSSGWQVAVRLYGALSASSGAEIWQNGVDAGSGCFPVDPDSYHLAISDNRDADMPGMPGETGAVACAGVNCSEAPFLAERFLREPAERLLSRVENRAISRHQIMEVYPLVATGRREADTLLEALMMFAEADERQYVLGLTTRGIRLMLRRLGIAFTVIADTGSMPTPGLQVAAIRLRGD